MPYTLNGIGTHYYGKKNHSVRAAVCKSCQRMGNLESYDTRLWVVVVFIPIIPLGRKRILDKCPACTRHYAMKADAYEQAKQLQTSGGLERFRREPSTDAALETHAQLVGFHEYQQAAEFRRTALARFPDHAGLRANLAEQLVDASAFDEAAGLFRDALELDPDLPEARVGVARGKMVEGKLDDAERLLDFLMEPGAGQHNSLGPLDVLAGSFQRVGRHEDALRIADVLRREIPKLEDDHDFRSFVRRSEKALHRSESTLPARRFAPTELLRSEGSHYAPWQRKLAIGTVVTALIVTGLAVNNEYIRRHRTLYVLNATGEAAQVQVDDRPAEAVSGLGRLTVAEGPHVVKVSGPLDASYDVALSSGYFARWFSQPAWILNLGGEAVVEDVTHVYSAEGTPGHRHLLVGETFINRPNVDYLFTAAPDQIEISSKTAVVEKTEIGWGQVDDLNAFLATVDTNRKAALEFAEKRLRRKPDQPDLLKNYVLQAAQGDADRRRAEAFLKSGLDRRPVDVGWHRMYQSVAELNSKNAELIAMYDGLLAADPSSGSLLYLRGRIDDDWDAEDSYYRRAIAADPKLGWPWMALAGRAATEARWDESLASALKAQELKGGDPETDAELIHTARMAKGEAKALVAEYRAAVAANAMDFTSVRFLLDALAASGGEAEIEPAINAWIARLPVPAQGQVAPHLRAMGLYSAGKLEECVDFCASNPLLKGSPHRLHALRRSGPDEGSGRRSGVRAALGQSAESARRERRLRARRRLGSLGPLARQGRGLDEEGRRRERTRQDGGVPDRRRGPPDRRGEPSLHARRRQGPDPGRDRRSLPRRPGAVSGRGVAVQRLPGAVVSTGQAGRGSGGVRQAMTREAFAALVRRIEGRYEGRQEALERTVATWATVGLAGLLSWMLLVTGLGLLIFVAGAFIEPPGGVLMIVVGAMLAIFGVLQAWYVLRTEYAPPDGRLIEPGEAPGLDRMLDDLRRLMQCRPFDEVRITTDFNAGVAEYPRLGLLGWPRTILKIGMPLARATSPDELRAIVAHEFAHISARHGRSVGRINRLDWTWGNLFRRMQRPADNSLTRWSRMAVARFVGWYWPRLHARGLALARSHEFQADREAARIVGDQALATALWRLEMLSPWLSDRFWPDLIAKAAEQPDPPADVLNLMAAAMRTPPSPEDAALWTDRGLIRATLHDETHPALLERVRPLGLTSDDLRRLGFPEAPSPSAAEALLGDLAPAVDRELSEQWRSFNLGPWRERHRRASAEARRKAASQTARPDAHADVAALWETARGGGPARDGIGRSPLEASPRTRPRPRRRGGGPGPAPRDHGRPRGGGDAEGRPRPQRRGLAPHRLRNTSIRLWVQRPDGSGRRRPRATRPPRGRPPGRSPRTLDGRRGGRIHPPRTDRRPARAAARAAGDVPRPGLGLARPQEAAPRSRTARCSCSASEAPPRGGGRAAPIKSKRSSAASPPRSNSPARSS